jgi:hypothetical protein
MIAEQKGSRKLFGKAEPLHDGVGHALATSAGEWKRFHHKCEINIAVRHVPRAVLTISLLGMKLSSINGFMPIESRKSKMAVMS